MQRLTRTELQERARGPMPRRGSKKYWRWWKARLALGLTKRRALVALKMKTCVRYVKRNMKADADR